jgi:hypothetical protein
MDTVESMKSPMISGRDEKGKDRFSDQSKNTVYLKQLMENKLSSNKTNTTVQQDNEYEFDNEVFNEEHSNKSSELSKANKGFLFK